MRAFNREKITGSELHLSDNPEVLLQGNMVPDANNAGIHIRFTNLYHIGLKLFVSN